MFEIFTKEGLLDTLYFLPALLIALSVHEAAHAFVAYKLGDKSQKAMGRLSISPFAHIDIIGFIFILLFKFGWGKPVIINDTCFKNRRKGSMLVALAGPLSNVVLAILFTVIYKLLIVFGAYEAMLSSTFGKIGIIMLNYAISFNLIFAVFNLIPLPPFDGAKVLYYFLPRSGKAFMDKIERYSLWILIFLMITGFYEYLILPLYSLLSMVITFILNL